MTVAAVMLFSTVEDALADAAGRPAVRRMVESAWAGGATPIVVVAPDEGARVAGALAGSPAVLAEPPPDADAAAQVVRGLGVAVEQVAETDAALVWPGNMVWVDAETVTTLIERHGVERRAVVQPLYDDAHGWPVLLPISLVPALEELSAVLPGELVAELGTRGHQLVQVDTGDPGTVRDRSTPIEALPPYAGPPEPARPAPEWGAAAADEPEDDPLAGPALAPYPQAADETAG